LLALADELRRSGPYEIVESAFLELAEPTIEAAARRCVEDGSQRVILVPYFLSAGVHVTCDLQDHCDRLATEFAPVEFTLAQPLGRHPLLREIVLQRASEVS
jgi:sirohydrochlorin ferrochelatase